MKTMKKTIALMITLAFALTLISAAGQPAPQAYAAVTVDEPILTVKGDGVEREVSFTLAELKAMTAYISRNAYSAWNTWPTKQTFYAQGVALAELLKRAGLKEGATMINVATKPEADGRAGYNITFLLPDLLAERYTFEGAKAAVPAIIAFRQGDKGFDTMEEGDLRLIFGQLDAQEQTSLGFVKSARIITVTCDKPRKLPAPEAKTEPVPGGGYSVSLTGGSAAVKIYYTTDGTAPTVHGKMYNISAPNWQPEMNQPFRIQENTVVRAIAVAAGYENSDELSFSIAQGQITALTQPPAQAKPPVSAPEPAAPASPAPSAPSPEAADGIKVYIDGEAVAFDVPPQNIGGRILVPLRAIFEALGAEIEWDGAAGTVIAQKGGTVVALTIGDASPTVDGEAVALDQPGVIVEGRTLAPLRFVAEAFGGSVEWDGAAQAAYILR
ncbi:MAG: stalk domain-containing protein [Clostridiales bacterium]|nr:stalk domain-containing protein [Clostridiales bacterium]